MIKQCEEFLKICEDQSDKYFLSETKLKQIDDILKLLVMPRGLKAGSSIYSCSCGYQWLLYASILCIMYRENPDKRRYETAILEIVRKNFKTFTIATIFVLLFLLEPKFSKFYSVAPDGALSREVKTAIEEILKSSPLVYLHADRPRFKILRDYIECNLNENRYVPLNYSNSRMDGKLPNVFLADEVEKREKAELDMKKAIREKSWISTHREAKSMNLASQKTKEVKKLKVQLDLEMSYATVKKVEKITGRKYDWQALKKYCERAGLGWNKAFDSNYGSVNSYPAEAWKNVYGVDIERG